MNFIKANASTILHVDADAFFASVEQRLNPGLKGKPVVVGGGERGVVSSASYEARKYGIHSAMPTYKAKQLCPEAIFVAGDFRAYQHFSNAMFRIFKRYTPTVERTSIDEGYLDLSGTEAYHKKSSIQISQLVLAEVNQTLGITVSGALSTNKMISKIASSLFKPRQLSCILAGQEKMFLNPLSINVMPGIGSKTAKRLNALGIQRLGDLSQMSFEKVWSLLGPHGVVLWERSRGIDKRRVTTEKHARKSISKEHTFPIDIDSDEVLWNVIQQMLKKVCFRLRKESKQAKVVTLKIRTSDFQTHTFRRTLHRVTHLESEFKPHLKQLLQRRDRTRSVRLIGVGLSEVQTSRQLELFSSQNVKKERLTDCLDELREKYGEGII